MRETTKRMRAGHGSLSKVDGVPGFSMMHGAQGAFVHRMDGRSSALGVMRDTNFTVGLSLVRPSEAGSRKTYFDREVRGVDEAEGNVPRLCFLQDYALKRNNNLCDSRSNQAGSKRNACNVYTHALDFMSRVISASKFERAFQD